MRGFTKNWNDIVRQSELTNGTIWYLVRGEVSSSGKFTNNYIMKVKVKRESDHVYLVSVVNPSRVISFSDYLSDKKLYLCKTRDEANTIWNGMVNRAISNSFDYYRNTVANLKTLFIY